MFKGKGEILVDVAATGLAAMLWILLFGRALNSPLAMRATSIPLLGPAIGSLRAGTNQIYDVSGQD